MSLVSCMECSKEMSDQAAACPHCGAPRKGPLAEPAKKRAGSGTLLGVGGCIGGIGALALLVVAGMMLVRSLNNASIATTGQTFIPEPRFEVAGSTLDDGCSKLLDYCVRVTCPVSNAGNAAGSALVKAVLHPKGKPEMLKTKIVHLQAGEQENVVLDFPEYSMSDSADGECIVVRQ